MMMVFTAGFCRTEWCGAESEYICEKDEMEILGFYYGIFIKYLSKLSLRKTLKVYRTRSGVCISPLSCSPSSVFATVLNSIFR